jgi:hypothetical protein
MAEVDTSLFNISPDLIVAFVSLIKAGKSERHTGFYINHRTINDATYAVIEILLPVDRSKKGTIRLVGVEEISYPEPILSPDIKSYGKRTFTGYNIYLHPDHESLATIIKQGNQQIEINQKVGLMILKERGCFTFKL